MLWFKEVIKWQKEIFIEYVVSDNPNKYPNDGEQGGYYWELYGTSKTLISFTIDGTSYQAESGMTWGEWVESSYNTGGATNVGSSIDYRGLTVVINNRHTVLPSEQIIHLQEYNAVASAGGGGN